MAYVSPKSENDKKAEALKVGDTVLLETRLYYNYGYNKRYGGTFYLPAIIEKTSKTTVTINGVTYLRSRRAERCASDIKRCFVFVGDEKQNTQEEVDALIKDISERKILLGKIDKAEDQLVRNIGRDTLFNMPMDVMKKFAEDYEALYQSALPHLIARR